jgi:hypothetical protein
LLLGQCFLDLFINPPTLQRSLGTAKEDLVPKSYPPIDAVKEIVARKNLMLIEPTLNT